ncbi:uncharacterized protein [Procambarus clarkii]|uniref:uncharacterized protein n=1 Tax=Procambarus clarkii TaxID=6728 RepID=UPI003743D02B
MAKLLLVRWCWAWILVVGVGVKAATVYMGETPIRCLVNDTSQFTTKSRIMCALICTMHQGFTFSFQGGVCTVGGAGEAVGATHMRYTLTNIPDCSALQEVAHAGKTAYASSIYSTGYDQSKAIDADLATWFASLGGSEQRPWWMLDLANVLCICRIQLLPRGAPDDSLYFRDIEVRVGSTNVTNGNFSSWALYATYPGPYSYGGGYIDLLKPVGVCGRYISVQRVVDNPSSLKLFNVNVFIC